MCREEDKGSQAHGVARGNAREEWNVGGGNSSRQQNYCCVSAARGIARIRHGILIASPRFRARFSVREIAASPATWEARSMNFQKCQELSGYVHFTRSVLAVCEYIRVYRVQIAIPICPLILQGVARNLPPSRDNCQYLKFSSRTRARVMLRRFYSVRWAPSRGYGRSWNASGGECKCARERSVVIARQCRSWAVYGPKVSRSGPWHALRPHIDAQRDARCTAPGDARVGVRGSEHRFFARSKRRRMKKKEIETGTSTERKRERNREEISGIIKST